MSLGINRRKFPRVQYKCRSSFNCDEGVKVLDAITENISTGGVCVLFNEDVGLFNKVAMELFLEDRPIQCEGIVSWIIKKQDNNILIYETGIEFSRIEETDRKTLYTKVEKELKSQ